MSDERTPEGRRILPHVEVLGDFPVPARIPQGIVTIAKIPGGNFHEMTVQSNMCISDLFNSAEIDIRGCRIQKNGEDVGLDGFAGPRDEVYAYPKIRGN